MKNVGRIAATFGCGQIIKPVAASGFLINVIVKLFNVAFVVRQIFCVPNAAFIIASGINEDAIGNIAESFSSLLGVAVRGTSLSNNFI